MEAAGDEEPSAEVAEEGGGAEEDRAIPSEAGDTGSVMEPNKRERNEHQHEEVVLR